MELSTSQPKYRRDALPEFVEYRDTGCTVAPSCLACPLPQCRYDIPGGARTMGVAARRAAILADRAAGMGTVAIARKYGVSRRTVWRHLSNFKK